MIEKKKKMMGTSGGPVVKSLPWKGGDLGSIPGWGTKIPHAAGQLNLQILNYWVHTPQVLNYWVHTPQLESPCTAVKDPSWHNDDLACHK